MRQSKLEDWIRQYEDKGYTREQIKAFLVKRGFSAREIEEMLGLKPHEQFDAKGFFRPTFAKLFIPILFFVILLSSLAVNSFYARQVGSSVCGIVTDVSQLAADRNSLKQYVLVNNADPEEFIRDYTMLMQKSVVLGDKMRGYGAPFAPIAEGNIYYIYSAPYVVYPFLDVPCEAIAFGFPNIHTSCANYISKADYDCYMQGYKPDHQAAFTGREDMARGYHPVNKGLFFMHSLIFSILLYLIMCILGYAISFIENRKLWAAIIIAILAIWIVLLLSGPKLGPGAAGSWTVSIYLAVLSFAALLIYLESIGKKMMAYILAGVLLLAMVGGIVMLSISLGPSSENEAPYEHDLAVFYCNETKMLNYTEKLNILKNPSDPRMDEEWNVCTRCPAICQGVSDRTMLIAQFRGDRPSCVCDRRS